MTENLSTEILEKIEWFDRNFEDIKSRIAAACRRAGKSFDDVTMLAATKTVPVEVINHAIKSGVKFIGENRVQEFLSKRDDLLPDAHRHFIGHLQTNKVKDIVGEVEMIESVHSEKLAAEINRLCEKSGKVMDILLEVNIGNEESKSGFSPLELEENVLKISKMPFVRIKGLMAIPPICENNEKNRQYFEDLSKLFIDIKTKIKDNVDMVYLSMGMSGDFEEAIECGANIVRIGTALFGQRDYSKTK